MRGILAAALVGAALGVALLGYGLDRTRSASVQPERAAPTAPRAAGLAAPTAPLPPAPGAHADANSEGMAVYLNQNVISGVETRVCTEEPALYTALATAIQRWETALAPLQLFELVDGRGANSCTGAGAPDIDVLVRFGTDCPGTPNACYRSFVPRSDEALPRRFFRYSGSQDHSVIIYEGGAAQNVTTVRLSTIMHELGHVLGLSDYDDATCDGLHQPPIGMPPIFTYAANDVDRGDDDLALMLSPAGAACRSADVITGRDRRDFHEAYQVGAIPNVRAVPAYITGPDLTLTLDPTRRRFVWNPSDAEAAGHNAQYIAVVGRLPGDAVAGDWRERGAVEIRDGQGNLMHEVAIQQQTTPQGAAIARTEFQVVGLTRGGPVRRNAAWAEPLPAADRATGALGAHRYMMGDPTVVHGDVWNTASPRLYLSASISPGACYISGAGAAGTLPLIWSAGSSTEQRFTATVTLEVTINGTSVYDQTASTASGTRRIPCSSISGNRSIAVTATASGGNAGSQSQTETVNLVVQDRNHDNPPRFQITSVPASCTQGGTLSVGWSLSGGVPPVTVYIAGVKDPDGVSPTSVPCPNGTRERVSGLALAADGSGDRAASGYFNVIAPPVTVPAAPTNLRTSSQTQISAVLRWDAVAGAAGYVVRRGAAGGPEYSTTGTSYYLWLGNAGTAYDFYVWALNSAGASPAVRATVRSAAPTLAAPASRIGAVTDTAVTLHWTAVAGAGYEVWRSGMGAALQLPAVVRNGAARN